MEKELSLQAALRIVFGVVFLWGGIQKMFLVSPVPVGKIITFMSSGNALYWIGLVEFLIGLFVALGMFTKISGWAALGFAALGLILAFPAGMGFLASNLVLIVVALMFGIKGSANFSLDGVFAKKM